MTQRKLMCGYGNAAAFGWSTRWDAKARIRSLASKGLFEHDQTVAQKKSPLIERA
jgi:hypothetical protein